MIRPRSRGRLILWLLVILTCGGALLWALAPSRVRNGIDRYLFTDRIWAPIEILLTTPPNPPADSLLALYDLTIPVSSKLELEANPPDSLRQYVRAVFTYRGKSHPVKIKVRGDTEHHWAGITRSWRVRFRKDDLFDGIRRLNLIRPKHRSKLEMYLNNWLAREMGFLAPRGTFVRLRINGEDQGVYYQVEQTDEFFLHSKQRTFGEIYDSDTKDHHPGFHSFLEPTSWSKMTVFTEESRGDQSLLTDLSALLEAVDQETQVREIPRRIDLATFLRSSAYMTLVGSVHRDRKHNIRLYLDPTNGRFEPVLWDIGGFGHDQVFDDYEIDIPLELPYNTLQQVLLSIAPFRDARNRFLWQAMHEVASQDAIQSEIDRQVKRIEGDMRADRWKIHNFRASHRPLTTSHWIENVGKLRHWVRERHRFIEESLASTRWAWVHDSGGFQLHVTGFGGLDLHEVDLSGGVPGAKAYFDRNGNHRLDSEDVLLGSLESVAEGRTRLRIEHRFHSGRRRVENERLRLFNLGYHLAADVTTVYPVRIDSTDPVRILAVRATDSITGGSLESVRADLLPAEQVEIPYVPVSLTPVPDQTIRWSGDHTVEGVFETTSGQVLEISAGTTVRMAPGASVVLRGPVYVKGTAQDPVHFVRLDPNRPWGSFAIEGPATAGSVLRYARFVGGKQQRVGGARFLAAVCAYNTTLRFEYCDWIGCVGEDALNVKHGDVDLLGCRFLRNEGDGYDSDFSVGEVRECLFYFNRDDGLDCGTSSPEVIDCLFLGQGDKGISVGESSSPRVVHCLFWDNQPGTAIKDRSKPSYVACAFIANRTVGADLYRKKEMFGGSNARFLGCLFLANAKDVQVDRFSSYEAVGCAAGVGLRGDGNVLIPASDPPGLDVLAAGGAGWIDRVLIPEEVGKVIREALDLKPETPVRIGLQRPMPFLLPTEVPATRPARMAEKDR